MLACKVSFQNYKNVSRLGLIDLAFSMAKEGISSFLILYLVNYLHFTDQAAYEFIGLKEVISYTIPLASALLVASHLQTPQATLIGMGFIGLGCFILCFSHGFALKIGMGFFLFGYGLGKPTLPLLIAVRKDLSQIEKDTRVRHLYALGSIAALLSPFLIGLIGDIKNWSYSFGFLSLFCTISMVFSYTALKKDQFLSKNWLLNISCKNILLIFLLAFLVAFPFFFPLLKNILLLGALGAAIWFFLKLRKTFSPEEKKLFNRLLILLGVIIVFFTFQSQEYMLFPLYIERCMDKTLGGIQIKTPWFHMIAPISILLGTPFLSAFFQNENTSFTALMYKKILWSFLTLFLSFVCIYFSTFLTSFSLILAFISYALFCVGEVLLIPTSQEFINRFASEHIKRILMGVLYLTMAIARLSGSWMSQKLSQSLYSLSPNNLLFFRQSFKEMMILIGVVFLFTTFSKWYIKFTS